MEYLFKLKCSAKDLPDEIKYTLQDEFNVNITYIEEVGRIDHDGRLLIWLVAKNMSDPDEAYDLIAKGHDRTGEWSPVYRIFGDIEKTCPLCDAGNMHNDMLHHQHCSRCGTKLIGMLS